MHQEFYLGIDVSKGYADFVILSKDKTVIEDNFQLDDTFEGHNQLYKILFGFIARYPGAELFAAAESTGGYENNWLCYLKQMSGHAEFIGSKDKSLWCILQQ